MIDDLRAGKTRMLDKNVEEFDLLPLGPKNTTPKTITGPFAQAQPRDFPSVHESR